MTQSAGNQKSLSDHVYVWKAGLWDTAVYLWNTELPRKESYRDDVSITKDDSQASQPTGNLDLKKRRRRKRKACEHCRKQKRKVGDKTETD